MAKQKSIRDDLASLGIEFAPDDMQQILQHAANCASLIGGYCILDSGMGWEIEVELDPDAEDEATVTLFTYELESPDEEQMN